MRRLPTSYELMVCWDTSQFFGHLNLGDVGGLALFCDTGTEPDKKITFVVGNSHSGYGREVVLPHSVNPVVHNEVDNTTKRSIMQTQLFSCKPP